METTKKNLRRLFSACAVLLSAAAFAAPQVTTTSGTVKVRPTQPAPADSPVDLIAAKNEFVSFQVVVQADAGGANNVSASFTGLKGAGDIPQSNITLYREGYLNITQPSFPTSPAGMYPDPMIPDVDETVGEKRNAFPFSVPANESRVIWVDVLVPQNANAGAYEGTVTLTGDGFQKDVPVKLNVVNTELPSTSSVNTAFLFAWNNACNVHTGNSECNGDSYALRTKYEKLALEHRITLSNTLIYPGDGNWAAFDQLYAPWIDGTLPTRLPGAKMTTIQFPGPRDPAHYTDFANHFESKGWLSRAYDYTGDEPPFGISFGEALSRAQAVKAAAPKLRTLLTTTATAAEQNGIAQYLDLIVPVVNFMDGVDAEHMGDQRATYDNFVNTPGKQLWIYQSCMSHGCAFGSNTPGNSEGAGWPSYMADASAARNRAMQWVVFLENANGELYYETALALDTSWDSIYRFAGNGDGTLFYPGLPSRIGGTTDVPLPSLRMKEIRQGMQDYEWLKKVADAGDPTFARNVARQLIPTAHGVPDDGAKFDEARRQLISRYLELKPDAAQVGSGTLVLGGSGDNGTPAGANPDDAHDANGTIIAGNGSADGSGGTGGHGCSATGSSALLPAFSIAAVAFVALRRRRTAQQ